MRVLFGVAASGAYYQIESVIELIRITESRLLLSFHYDQKTMVHIQKGGNKMERRIDLFLDSGAYSAFTQGVEIDIQEYMSFIKKNREYIDVYANLDVIKDPVATWENQQIMEAAGLHPLPVFHIGSDYSYLQRYLDKGYDYIGLGIAGIKGEKILIPWLDRCFGDYLCDEKGMPKVKVHGFGITRLDILFRYPWWSVDSTSWVMTSRYGLVYVPRFKDGKWIYDENPWKVCVSNRCPHRKKEGEYFTTFPPAIQKIILQYLDSKGVPMGRSEFKPSPGKFYKLKNNERWAEGKKKEEIEVIVEEGLCNSNKLRDQINIVFFLDLEKAIPAWPWAFKMKRYTGLF